MMIKRKIKEWLKRYLLSEIVCTITALVAAIGARFFTSNMVIIAYAGAIGEAIGFYSTIFIQELILANQSVANKSGSFSFKHLAKIIGSLVLEFGPAGVLDGLLLRPFFMFVFPIILKNFTLGILVGKLVGDLVFYMLVIISYELKNYKKSTNT